MKRWVEDLINIFFPGECHLCGDALAPHEKFVCSHCLQSLPRTGYHRIPNNAMEDRFAGWFKFRSATGHFFYNKDSSLAQLIQDMKYRGYSSIGTYIGEICGRELYPSGFLNDIDYLVPVPMHFIKQCRRGYNQTEKIAEGISRASDIPVYNAVKMTKLRKTQTSLSRSDRIRNAEGLFKIRDGVDFDNKGVLVIDDICTTGTTVGAVAKEIYDKFPSAKISIFTLGVTF